MLTSKGHIKIIDFGTASIVDQKKATPELWHAEMQKHKNLDKSSKEHQPADNNQETEIQDYRNRQSSFVGTAEYNSLRKAGWLTDKGHPAFLACSLAIRSRTHLPPSQTSKHCANLTL